MGDLLWIGGHAEKPRKQNEASEAGIKLSRGIALGSHFQFVPSAHAGRNSRGPTGASSSLLLRYCCDGLLSRLRHAQIRHRRAANTIPPKS
ncbi:MAG TPA: hypothetical protein VLK25_07915 [Allosphingosinicella sp.]|nr:hypothetical protein [Allosphingosinicella sp.]